MNQNNNNNNNNDLLASTLKELRYLRRDVSSIQRTLQRIETNSTSNTSQGQFQPPTPSAGQNSIRRTSPVIRSNSIPRSSASTATLSSTRQLINNIAHRPPTGHCWYHRRHGIDANIHKCPGAEECSFDMPAEILKMKAIIAKASLSITPAQNRISNRPRINMAQKPAATIKAPIAIPNASKTPAPEQLPTTKRRYTAASQKQLPATEQNNTPAPPNPEQINWAEQIENELDAMDIPPEPLEEQLANLSD